MPLSRKLTPAALPAFTTISRVARTEVCAGAMRFSSATGLPSARIEIHVFSSARTSRVKVGVVVAMVGALVFAGGLLAGRLAAVDDVGDGVASDSEGGGVLLESGAPVEMVADASCPDDKVPKGAAGPTFSESLFSESVFSESAFTGTPEAGGCVAGDFGAEAGGGTGAGDRFEAATEPGADADSA